MRRTLQLALSLLAVSVLLLGSAGTSWAHVAGVHVMKVKPAHSAHHKGGGSVLLFSHGGPIETSASVYLDYWGPQWAGAGFSTGSYTSAQAQSYVESFFGNVGGSGWANSTTQYCQGVASGTTTCPSSAAHPTNPVGELAGTWNDTTALPSNITQTDVANAALRAVAKFGYNANANYMVFTPSGHSSSGFRTTWCAYHSSTSSSAGSVSFSYIPYQPDAGASCGMNFVNPSNNAFGNGYFDGFSIVGGHEYGETITDPFPSSGWLDGSGAENGDKCAWISSGQGASANILLGANNFAVQSLWSNAFNSGAGGCVLS
jgi:serine protease